MSTGLTAAVIALAGVAVVVAVSWVFYRIGRSEDREREQQEAAHGDDNGNHRAPGLARERRRRMPPRRP